MPLNKYASNIKHTYATALLLWSTYRPDITARSKIQQSATATPHIIAKCARNKYSPLMLHLCHICKLPVVQIWDNCSYIYLISTHCNRKCNQEHCHTKNSHYWHMHLDKYACHIANMSHCTNTSQESSTGRAADCHVTGFRLNTCSQLNLARGSLSPSSLCG